MSTDYGQDGQYWFSVCICTRNRPDDLFKALQSLARSEVPVYEIIVSDDSTDLHSKRIVLSQFPKVRYLTGPKKGLSVNRNNALRAVSGTHVLFIDDDVILTEDFFTKMTNSLQRHEELYGRKVIMTGLENKNGAVIYPHDQTFLGFQSRKYKEGEPIHTIVINSTVFPAELFKEINFDEQLIYGYEEVDIATRAVQRGYKIVLCEETLNYHYPSEINRDFYKPHIEISRLYATFKRYLFTERKPLKAVSFLLVANLHTIRHRMKAEGGKGLITSYVTIKNSYKYIRTHYQSRRLKKTMI